MIKIYCLKCEKAFYSEFDDADCPNCNPEKVIVYVVSNKNYRGRSFLVVGACSTFEKAKELAFKGWNGEVKVIKSVEEHINDVGLNHAYYIIELTNVNGVSSYYIEIKKFEVDELVWRIKEIG